MPSYPIGILLLQYVDHTTLFMEGSVEGARNISTLLDLFADLLGLPHKLGQLSLHWLQTFPAGPLPICLGDIDRGIAQELFGFSIDNRLA